MPPAILGVGGALASAAGGLIGNLAGSGNRSDADAARRAALEAITGVSLPTVESQQLALQQLQQQGTLTPETLQALQQGDTELANISTDPRLKDAQMGALNKLIEQGNTGLTASDRAALNQTRANTERDVKGRNEAVLQGMAQRGMGGAGAELASQLLNSQEGADRAAQESDRLAAMAQQNALQATLNSGTLGGQIRQQDFDQAAQAAKAQDIINQFNTQNSQGVAQYNVGARNTAQQQNLAEKQRVADTNVNLKNQEQQYNKALIQQDYQNRLNKANAVAGAQNGQAAALDNRANQTANMWSNIGQGVGKAAMGGAQYLASQPKAADPMDSYNWKSSEDLNKAKDGAVNLFNKGGTVTDLPLMRYLHGGKVEGTPIHKGDHPENDTVDAKLSPGEVVLPNSILDASDDAIMAFVKLAKKSRGQK